MHIAKRISGFVIACDGTVRSGALNSIGGKTVFKSVADATYYKLTGSDRLNKGWLMYEFDSSNYESACSITGISRLKIETIMDLVIECKFYS